RPEYDSLARNPPPTPTLPHKGGGGGFRTGGVVFGWQPLSRVADALRSRLTLFALGLRFSLAAFALVDGFLRDYFVHEDVVFGGRNGVEELAFEGKGDERGVEAGVLEELVVVALAMAHASASAVEGDAGDHDDVERGDVDDLGRQAAQLG